MSAPLGPDEKYVQFRTSKAKHTALKIRAAQEGTSMEALMAEALDRLLEAEPATVAAA